MVELDDHEYFSTDRSAFGQGMQQLVWHTDREQNGYGLGTADSNVNGHTNPFRGADGRVRTLVLIRRSVPASKPHREFKYMLKLVALLHELGHIHDMEQQVNFDHAAGTFDVMGASAGALALWVPRHERPLDRSIRQNARD